MIQTILSGLVGLFFTALLLGVCWVWFLGPIVRYLFKPIKGMGKGLGSTFTLGVSVGNKLIKRSAKKVVDAEGVVAEGTVLWDSVATPNYEIASWVKGHPVKKLGYILFRGYSKHLERCLVIEGNPLIQKKYGRRIQLPTLEGRYLIGDLQVVQRAIEEAENMFEKSVSKVLSKSSPPKAVASHVPDIEQSQSTAVPAVKKDKPLEAYKGHVISYGKAMRQLASSKDSDANDENGKEIEQFRVVIRSEDGVDESIWGQDLFRAIKDANIMINDMVEVIKTGKRQFGTVWKNLYVINKIA